MNKIEEFDRVNKTIRAALEHSCQVSDSFCQVIDRSNGKIKKAILGGKLNADINKRKNHRTT